MNRGIIGLALSSAAVLSMGCSHLTMLRTEELRQIQYKVDSLQTRVETSQQALREEQKRQSEMLRLIRADQQVRFAELERSVSTLAGSISESQYRLTKIDEKTQEIKKAWEEKARTDSLLSASQSAELDNLFEIAYGDFIAGRYEVATNGFQDIVQRFPESKKADLASYWIAEGHYAQRKYAEAEKAYKNYIKERPEGEKVCTALFKLGLVYDSLKKEQARSMVWQKLQTQCPDSEEAVAVEARMDE